MTPHICVSVAEATEPNLEELLQDGSEASLPSRREESPPLYTVEDIWMTACQVEPRLHLNPPHMTRPDFAMSDMVVAKANRQLKEKFIFSGLSHISVQYWWAGHPPPQTSCAVWENGGARVGKKVCTTSVYTWPCRIKTTTLAGGKQMKETRIGRVTSSLTKRPDRGIHQWQLHGE